MTWPQHDPRTTLPDRSEVETAQTMAVWSPTNDEDIALRPTIPPTSPTAYLAGLLSPLADKLRVAAQSMLWLADLEREWSASASLYPSAIQATRAKACGPLASLVEALEDVEREADRLALSVELEDCLPTESSACIALALFMGFKAGRRS